MSEDPSEPAARLGPENLRRNLRRQFNEESWRHYHESCDQAEHLREQVRAEVEREWATLPYFGPRYDEYLASQPVATRIQRSDLRAARTILRSLADGYPIIDIPREVFIAVMDQEIEALTNSLKLSRTQLEDLRGEFIDAVVAGRAPNRPDPRTEIEDFISKVQQMTGQKITRTNIWRVAGYQDATEFQRFQRGARVTETANSNFTRVLIMNPEDFLRVSRKRPLK